ncbi:MAG: c-type cytochrome domain-containing protein, partial [Candidatus Hydrogenedentes bacterium]|nr:c-type cytochrome domain-containing protein [Candidatus Hydrogenedentota bacterium]
MEIGVNTKSQSSIQGVLLHHWMIISFAVAILFAPLYSHADVLFEKDVLPILQKSCSACHFPPVEPLKGKLDLSTLAATLKGGGEGAVIVPGKADESRLIQMVEGKVEPVMPPKGKADPLTPEAIAILKQWINEGAKGQEALPAPTPAPAPVAET